VTVRRSIVLRLACLALLVLALVPGAAFADGPLETRTFAVRFRTVSDAVQLVSPLLSPEGSLRLRPAQRMLVVEDQAVVLDRVRLALERFDTAPRNVEISFTLLLGSDTRPASAPRGMDPSTLSREIRGVHENLGDFTKWTNYELLGSQSVTVVEGHGATARLSDQYRVAVEVESVLAPSARSPVGVVVLKSLVLERLSRDAHGADRVEELYSTAMQLHAGKLLTVGAAQSPESRKAIFLTVKARPE
jgi:hypothetical protein